MFQVLLSLLSLWCKEKLQKLKVQVHEKVVDLFLELLMVC